MATSLEPGRVDATSLPTTASSTAPPPEAGAGVRRPGLSLRVIVRTAAVTAVTLLSWLILLLLTLAFFAVPKIRARARQVLQRWWCRSINWLLGVKLSVTGPVPRAGSILVANHLSYLDILVLGALVPARFVAKAEVRRWPLIGALCACAGTIFVDRGRRRDVLRVGDRMREALSHGDSVMFFPEGTSTSGYRVAPFRSSLLAPAAQQGLPVHYASLQYRTSPDSDPAHEAVCWWGDMPFLPHVALLLRQRSISASVVFGPVPIANDDRKKLASSLHAEVAAIFTPSVGFDPAAVSEKRPAP